MNKTHRLNQIEMYLNLYGSVDVHSLSQNLDTSEMTIRRDLSILASQGKAIRIHGGAILPTDHYVNGNGLESRSQLHIKAKKAIAKEAVKYIHSGDNIFLDDSSTVSAIVEFLPPKLQLINTTTSVLTAIKFNDFTNIDVICIGGKISKSTQSVVGPLATRLLESMYFKTAFLGIPNISESGIITTSSFDELNIKQTVLRQSNHKILLADSSKIRTPQHLHLADAKDFDRIITDFKVPEAFINSCKKQKIPLSFVAF